MKGKLINTENYGWIVISNKPITSKTKGPILSLYDESYEQIFPMKDYTDGEIEDKNIYEDCFEVIASLDKLGDYGLPKIDPSDIPSPNNSYTEQDLRKAYNQGSMDRLYEFDSFLNALNYIKLEKKFNVLIFIVNEITNKVYINSKGYIRIILDN